MRAAVSSAATSWEPREIWTLSYPAPAIQSRMFSIASSSFHTLCGLFAVSTIGIASGGSYFTFPQHRLSEERSVPRVHVPRVHCSGVVGVCFRDLSLADVGNRDGLAASVGRVGREDDIDGFARFAAWNGGLAVLAECVDEVLYDDCVAFAPLEVSTSMSRDSVSAFM